MSTQLPLLEVYGAAARSSAPLAALPRELAIALVTLGYEDGLWTVRLQSVVDGISTDWTARIDRWTAGGWRTALVALRGPGLGRERVRRVALAAVRADRRRRLGEARAAARPVWVVSPVELRPGALPPPEAVPAGSRRAALAAARAVAGDVWIGRLASRTGPVLECQRPPAPRQLAMGACACGGALEGRRRRCDACARAARGEVFAERARARRTS